MHNTYLNSVHSDPGGVLDCKINYFFRVRLSGTVVSMFTPDANKNLNSVVLYFYFKRFSLTLLVMSFMILISIDGKN